jgi:hypothetical protein
MGLAEVVVEESPQEITPPVLVRVATLRIAAAAQQDNMAMSILEDFQVKVVLVFFGRMFIAGVEQVAVAVAARRVRRKSILPVAALVDYLAVAAVGRRLD